MRSLTLRAITAAEQPALTLSCGGLTSAASGVTRLPGSETVMRVMTVTCKLPHMMIANVMQCCPSIQSQAQQQSAKHTSSAL